MFTDEAKLSAIRKVTDEAKLSAIRTVLSPKSTKAAQAADEVGATLFELTGSDRVGLLTDVLSLLKEHGLAVCSAAVWTYADRVAFVVSVSDRDHALMRDSAKLAGLRRLLVDLMGGDEDGGTSVVIVSGVRGRVHYERRLHQLLLREEVDAWRASGLPEQYDALTNEEAAACVSVSSPAMHNSEPTPRLGSGVAGEAARSPTRAASAPPAPALDALPAYAQDASALATARTSVPASPGGAGAHAAPRARGPASPGGGGAYATARASVSASPGSSGAHAAPRAPIPASPGGGAPARHPGAPPLALLAQQAQQAQQAAAAQTLAQQAGVTVSHFRHRNYWMVDIKCADRTKLLFDTVCTLADLKYDVYHACVDCDNASTAAGAATMSLYVRPRYGDATWSPKDGAKLAYCLERAIVRRFPQGLKVVVTTQDGYDVCELMAALRDAGLLITRAKVNSLQALQTFYLLDAATMAVPEGTVVERACCAAGGRMAGVMGGHHASTANGASPLSSAITSATPASSPMTSSTSSTSCPHGIAANASGAGSLSRAPQHLRSLSSSHSAAAAAAAAAATAAAAAAAGGSQPVGVARGGAAAAIAAGGHHARSVSMLPDGQAQFDFQLSASHARLSAPGPPETANGPHR
ncbi:hypothetical protein FOA52_012077 [Chlamydomonas sp. UWO 241]|nr:hypothetical protein FOA52_012077 [Chlamydomonas sp. UWO 241]